MSLSKFYVVRRASANGDLSVYQSGLSVCLSLTLVIHA